VENEQKQKDKVIKTERVLEESRKWKDKASNGRLNKIQIHYMDEYKCHNKTDYLLVQLKCTNIKENKYNLKTKFMFKVVFFT
jgi:hypothetical protein